MDEQCEDVSHNIAQTHSPSHLKSLPKYQHQPGRNIEVRRRGREIHNMKKNVRKTHTQIQLRVQTLQRWAITLQLPHPPNPSPSDKCARYSCTAVGYQYQSNIQIQIYIQIRIQTHLQIQIRLPLADPSPSDKCARY